MGAQIPCVGQRCLSSGFLGPFSIARVIRELFAARAAAIYSLSTEQKLIDTFFMLNGKFRHDGFASGIVCSKNRRFLCWLRRAYLDFFPCWHVWCRRFLGNFCRWSHCASLDDHPGRLSLGSFASLGAHEAVAPLVFNEAAAQLKHT